MLVYVMLSTVHMDCNLPNERGVFRLINVLMLMTLHYFPQT